MTEIPIKMLQQRYLLGREGDERVRDCPVHTGEPESAVTGCSDISVIARDCAKVSVHIYDKLL